MFDFTKVIFWSENYMSQCTRFFKIRKRSQSKLKEIAVKHLKVVL